VPKVSTWQYEPYLNPAPLPSPGASVEAAVTIAAHNAMTAYFPAAAPTRDAARDTDLAAIPNGPAKAIKLEIPVITLDAWRAHRKGAEVRTTLTLR
jgi:hypothetical protein